MKYEKVETKELKPARASQGTELEVRESSAPPRRLLGWQGLALGLGLGAAIATCLPRLLPAPSPTAAVTAKPSAAPGQSVSVETAQTSQVAKTIAATGTVDAREWAIVKAQATGLQVQQILVQEGQTVQANQVIARLDDSVLQSQLNQAKAQLTSAQAQLNSSRAQLPSTQAVVLQKRAVLKQQQATLAEAESNLRRYQDLTNQGAETRQNLESRRTTATTARESVNVAQAGIVGAEADVGRTRADINRAEADVENAIAQVKKLETQLAQATVRAPVSGILAKPDKDSNGKPIKDMRVGDLTASDPLFYIVRGGALELRLKVPEQEIAQIQPGAAVRITSDANKGLVLQGRVREIDPLVNEQTRQTVVKIDLPPSPLLKPGMFLRAEVTVQTNQAVVIPAQAVLPQGDGRSMVYVMNDKNQVQQRVVEVGIRQVATDPAQARIEIKRGLKLGDRVVVAGAGFLHDGDRVTVAK